MADGSGVGVSVGIVVAVGSMGGGGWVGETAVGVACCSAGSAWETTVAGGTAVSRQPVARKKQKIRKIAAVGW